jgi:hypothetical protein
MKTTVDDREVMALLKKITLDENDLLDIEKAPALVIVNKQRELVPVDTSLTKNSVQQHIQESSDTEVIDHIGPETTYAPYIEFGVASKPNYPIQPFVRPSAFGNENNVARAAMTAFTAKVKGKTNG